MANRKISDLTALTAPAVGDLLPIVDISEAAAADKNKKITFGVFVASALSTAGIIVDASGNVNIDSNTLYVDAVNNLVGIGTSSPDGTTHVHTASAGTVTANSSADDLVVENNGGGGITILTPDGSNGSLFFGSPSDAVGAAARWNYTSGEFLIGSDKSGGVTKLTSGNGTTAVTIDSSQQVGIGTTSPGSALDVVGTGKFTATQSLIINGTSGTYSTWQHNGTSVGDLGTGNQVLAGGSTGDFAFTSRAGALAFGINTAEKARIDSSGRLLVGTSTDSGGALLQVNGDRIRVGTAKTPASASATGAAGEICWDANYIYVCTATNTWKRTAIATW